MERSDLPWDQSDQVDIAKEEVEIIHLEPGETGKRYNQVLQSNRLEKIADFFSTPVKTRGSVLALARLVGCSPASIRAWEAHPKMNARVKEIVTARALSLLVEAIEKGGEEITNGWNKGVAEFAAKVALGDSRRGSQVNVMIDNRRAQETESDMAFTERFRVAAKTGILRRFAIVEGTKGGNMTDIKHDPPDPEPEPEDEPTPIGEPPAE